MAAVSSSHPSSDLFADDAILPADPVGADGQPLESLHDREYRVRAFRVAANRVLIRGAVRDQKPPGLYFEQDPDPLTVHHMQVDIEVEYPSMEIVAAQVHMETHPNVECPRIEPHYGELVGLSIARGFTHKVRELFGGPRACTHTTALLQAMAPVAVQCMWSLRAANGRAGNEPGEAGAVAPMTRRDMWKVNLNSCHVWAEDSDVVAGLAAGGAMEPPEFARRRMIDLGIEPAEWARRMGS
ncbi:MAG: DUF2889 domain-containing protein [Ilumatobacter sp.]|nr:DUF2889 domain-containing protein [Ilumatobacter sp.]